MTELHIKQYLAAVAIILTFVGYLPYLLAILRNKAKPHAFSWFIWGITMSSVFVAQIYGGGGVGAASLGLSALIALGIAVISYLKKSDDTIAKMDWVFLCMALMAIPLWFFTANPLYAVMVLTIVDAIGYLPTLRKAYHKPFEENALVFFMMTISSIFALLALETYSLANMMFQVMIIIGNIIVISVLLIRRRSRF